MCEIVILDELIFNLIIQNRLRNSNGPTYSEVVKTLFKIQVPGSHLICFTGIDGSQNVFYSTKRLIIDKSILDESIVQTTTNVKKTIHVEIPVAQYHIVRDCRIQLIITKTERIVPVQNEPFGIRTYAIILQRLILIQFHIVRAPKLIPRIQLREKVFRLHRRF